LQKLKDAMEALGKAAGLAVTYEQQDVYDNAYATAVRIVEEHRELKYMLEAMVYLGSKGNAGAYRIGSNSTDFAKLIEETALTLKSDDSSSFDINNHPLMKVFVNNKDGLAGTEGAGNEVIDDDIEIQGGGSIGKNPKCPLTLVELIHLKEPVEDSKGFVYEKSALIDYIRKTSKGRGRVLAPIAEVNHYVSEKEIRPAQSILDAQRARMR
jgi:hypothetical protein